MAIWIIAWMAACFVFVIFIGLAAKYPQMPSPPPKGEDEVKNRQAD